MRQAHLASQLLMIGAVTERPEWVPEAAQIHFDFVDDLFWDGGERTLSEILNEPSRDDADGVELVSFSASPQTELMGEIISFMAGKDFTIVLDFLLDDLATGDGGSGIQLFYLADPTDGSQGSAYLSCTVSPITAGDAIYVTWGDFYSPDISTYVERVLNIDEPALTGEMNRIAANYSLQALAVSMNGGDVVSTEDDIDDFAISFDRAKIGLYNLFDSHSGRIRRITVYPLLPSDALPVLSAIPPDETAPTITSSASVSVAENAALSHTLTANEAVTWSIVGGVDQAEFEVTGAVLSWSNSSGTQDYEAPADANSDNAYVVTVRATDAAANTADQTITVTVTDVAVEDGSGEPVGLLLALTKA